jgi:hypothetical protein
MNMSDCTDRGPVVAKTRDQLDRHYTVNKRPYVVGKAPSQSIQLQIRLHAFEQTVTMWKEFAGVRFKLLALLPPLSLGASIALLTASRAGFRDLFCAGFSAFALAVTHALYRYDRRNSALYNELISRGRRLEYELGVNTGIFVGRPEAQNERLGHDHQLRVIYWACISLWVFSLALYIGRSLFAGWGLIQPCLSWYL